MRTSRGVRRLGSSNGEERVFGSHFTARDFSRIESDRGGIRYVEEASSGKAVVEVPGDGGSGSYRHFHIDPETRLIEGILFYDSSGGVVKEYELLETGEVQGRPIPRKGRMEDHRSGGATTITIGKVAFPPSIPRRYFSRGNL